MVIQGKIFAVPGFWILEYQLVMIVYEVLQYMHGASGTIFAAHGF